MGDKTFEILRANFLHLFIWINSQIYLISGLDFNVELFPGQNTPYQTSFAACESDFLPIPDNHNIIQKSNSQLNPNLFICDNCNRSYNRKNNLKRHKTFECGIVAQFSCTLCSLKMKRKDNLQAHLFKKHSSNWNYIKMLTKFAKRWIYITINHAWCA